MVSRTSRINFAPNAMENRGAVQKARPRASEAASGDQRLAAAPAQTIQPRARSWPSYAPIRQMPAENPFHVAPDRRGWLGARQRLAMEAILVQHLGQVSDSD